MKKIALGLVLLLVFWFVRSSLIGKHPTPSQQGNQLLQAVEAGNEAEVRRLLDAKVPVDSVDRTGNTALYFSACRGHAAIAALLLDRGANINAVGPSKDTPLHCAAMLSKPEVAKLLIERGAEVNALSADGYTPLREASDPTIQALLVAKGAHM